MGPAAEFAGRELIAQALELDAASRFPLPMSSARAAAMMRFSLSPGFPVVRDQSMSITEAAFRRSAGQRSKWDVPVLSGR